MIKEKKPEKIILNILHTDIIKDVKEKINRVGIPCFDIQEARFSNEEMERALFITDSSLYAREYKGNNFAVLVYLHKGNKEQVFSKNRYFIEGFEDVDATYFTRIYQREKQIPWVIWEAERLVIREMTPADTEALYHLYEDKSVVEFMEDLPQNREEEKEYIAEYVDKVYGLFGFGMWLVVLRETGEIIGRVGFRNCESEYYEENERNPMIGDDMDDGRPDREMQKDMVELGFMIVPKYQHQGYAYEACRAAITYMEDEFPEYNLMARCKAENIAGIRLCKKLGIDCKVL